MKNKYFQHLWIKLSFLVLILASNACKKEYTDFPYSKIESFNIKVSDGTTLSASIVGQDILVYWPPFQEVPASVSPVISVSERATVSPASGTSVAFTEATSFKVTAQDGTVSTYNLKPVFTQPDFNSFTLTGSSVFGTTNLFRINSTIVVRTTDYLIADTSKTHVYLEATNGKRYQMPVSSVTSTRVTSTVATANTFPPIGTEFKVNVVSGIKSVTGTTNYVMAPAAPTMALTLFAAQTVQRGGSFTLTGVGDASYFTAASLATSSTGTYYPLTISARNGNSITFTIPSDFPTGTYLYFKYSYTADTYHAAATDVVLAITASTRRITVTQ